LEPNISLDLFRLRSLGIWTPGETVSDVLSNSETFAENCSAWFSVAGDVATEADLINEKSLNIMWQCDPFARGLFGPDMAPLLTITKGPYEYPTEITSYIHNPFVPEKLRAIYQAHGVECETLGLDPTNPVPTTLVGTPAGWIKTKLGIT
jgi:hypothetical protein